MKKLALGVLAGWAIRGAYELVWIHKSSYSEVIMFKVRVADGVKKVKEGASGISELINN